jgi:hypothetical protein
MQITEKELRDIVKSELIKEGFFDFKDSPVLKAIGLVDDAGQPALPNKEEILDPGETGETTVDNYILSDMTDLYMRLAEIIGNLFVGKTTMGVDADGQPKAETGESAVLIASKEKAQENLAKLERMTVEYEEKMQNLANTGGVLSQDEFDAAESELMRLEKQIDNLSKETEALPQNQGQLITKLIDKYFKKSFDLDNDGQIGDVDDLQMALTSMLDSKTFLTGSRLIWYIQRDMSIGLQNSHDHVVLKSYEDQRYETTYNVKYRVSTPFVNPRNFREEVNQEVSDTYGLSQDLITNNMSWSEINGLVQTAHRDIRLVNNERFSEFLKHLPEWFDSYMNSDASKTFKLSIKDGNLIATYQVVLLLPARDEDDDNFNWYTDHNTSLGNKSKESNLSLMHSLCDMAKSDELNVEELAIFGLKKTYKYKLELPPVYGEFIERNSEWAKYTKEIEEQMADVNAIAPDAPKIEIGKNYSEEEMQDIIDKVSASDTSDVYEKLLSQYKQKYDDFIAQSESVSALEGFKYIRDQNKPLPFKWTEIGRSRTYDGMSGSYLEELGIDEELAKKTTKLFCEYIESQNASYLQPITDDSRIAAKIAAEKEVIAKRRAEAEARKKREEEEAEAEAQRMANIQQNRQAAELQRQQDLRELGHEVVLINDIKSYVPALHADGKWLFHNDHTTGPFFDRIPKMLAILKDENNRFRPGLLSSLKGLRTMLRSLENAGELEDVHTGYDHGPNTPQYRRLQSALTKVKVSTF